MTTPTPVDWEGLKAKHADPKESAMNFAGDLLDAFPAILAAHERDQRVIAAAEKINESLKLMMDCWFDYHDANNLTQAATVRADIAMDKAIAAREEFDKAKR